MSSETTIVRKLSPQIAVLSCGHTVRVNQASMVGATGVCPKCPSAAVPACAVAPSPGTSGETGLTAAETFTILNKRIESEFEVVDRLRAECASLRAAVDEAQREQKALISEVAKFHPWKESGHCYFCGEMEGDPHDTRCFWQRCAAPSPAPLQSADKQPNLDDPRCTCLIGVRIGPGLPTFMTHDSNCPARREPTAPAECRHGVDIAHNCNACSDAAAAQRLRRPAASGPQIAGTWPKDCQQRAFVAGASWWMFKTTSSTPFSSERTEMENEAVSRYGWPRPESVYTADTPYPATSNGKILDCHRAGGVEHHNFAAGQRLCYCGVRTR